MEEDWKKSYQGAAARAQVDAYFKACMRLVDSERIDEAEHRLSRSRWRATVDLSAVPSGVVDTTDVLCADAVGLIEYGNPEAINGVVRRILSLWQSGAPTNLTSNAPPVT